MFTSPNQRAGQNVNNSIKEVRSFENLARREFKQQQIKVIFMMEL
jgi:hypothetical protein